jgi:hypothetical protein
MPELQSNNDLSSPALSTPVIQRSNQQQQLFAQSVIDTISSIYEKSLFKIKLSFKK